MASGTVTGIFISAERGGAVRSVEVIDAVPGRGLTGDRYYKRSATDPDHDPAEEVTLIAAEGLERARAEKGLDLGPGQHRRNLVTEGVDLDALIGVEFAVGKVRLKGLKSNPPCRYLEDVTGVKLVKGLIDGGGIRAEIVAGGTIKLGDAIAR